MIYWINLFAFIVASATAASPFTSKQFRSDYEYNKKTDAFYKLHIEGAHYGRARSICGVEGAKLLMPESQEDLIQVHALFKKFPDLGDYVLIESDGETHVSAEETPMVDLEMANDQRSGKWDVVNRNGEVESRWGYRDMPFACKVKAKDAPYNEECDVYSKDYVSKISTTGSCYRIASVQANWNEAYACCQSEGAHLIILNNPGEFEVVNQMIKDTSRAIEDWQFFVGIRAEKTEPIVFKTVFNQTLEEVGYQPWDDGEPSNTYGVEYCISMLKRNGKYNDTVCGNRYSYICEKERRT